VLLKSGRRCAAPRKAHAARSGRARRVLHTWQAVRRTTTLRAGTVCGAHAVPLRSA
jgi:hypothetical protein